MSTPEKALKKQKPATHVFVANENLEFAKVAISDTTPSSRHVLSAQSLSPHSDYSVIQLLSDGNTEELGLEEPVKFEGDDTPKLIIVKSDRNFRFILNERSMTWALPEISEKALRILGSIPANHIIRLEREDEPDEILSKGDITKLKEKGTEVFRSRAGTWKLNVQGVVIEHNAPTMVAREAIQKAGLDADTSWIIVLKTKDERKQIGIDDTIDLTLPGIEKLRLTPKEINNGEAMATLKEQAFDLLPGDVAGLNARGIDWQTLLDGGRRWLLLRGLPLPPGYQTDTVTVAVEIPTTYNAAELDMFYCHPPLSRSSGHPIPQTQVQQAIEGVIYQRWSRHRGPTSLWRPGVDTVISHLALIEESLNREVQ